MRRLFWWANLALAAATLVAYASPYVAPGRLWPVAFAGLAYPTLVLLHLAFAGVWLLRKDRRALLSVATVAVGYAYLGEYVGLRRIERDEAAATVTFANYNLLGGNGLYAGGADSLPANLARFGACVLDGVDVAAFQETPYYSVVRAGLRETLDAGGLRYHFSPGPRVPNLHSRYPLLDTVVVEKYNHINALLRADAAVAPGDTLRIFVAHLQSNGVRIDDLAREIIDVNRRAYWELRSVAANYRAAARKRAEQVRDLVAAIRESPYPVVVLGDLNDPPLSYAVGELRRAGLGDSFRESGTGLGVSYPGTIPGLRIDYVMASERLAFRRSEVLDCDFSDHKPVRAELLLP